MSDPDRLRDTDAPPLRVMTYNVRYPSPENERNSWARRREPLLTTVRFHHPDVVGLQEAQHSQVEAIRESLPAFEWLTAGRSGETYGDHPAVGFRRERFDLRADDTFWLSETPDTQSRGWDASLVRLVRYVRLHDVVTGRSFHWFNTHFDHRGATARLESASLLRARVGDVTPEAPVVVTGDLNSRPESEPYRRLTAGPSSEGPTLRDAATVAQLPNHGPTTTMTDFTDLIPEKKIDYVLVTPGITVTQHGICSDTYDGGRYPSDHLPVVADLVLPDPD